MMYCRVIASSEKSPKTILVNLGIQTWLKRIYQYIPFMHLFGFSLFPFNFQLSKEFHCLFVYCLFELQKKEQKKSKYFISNLNYPFQQIVVAEPACDNICDNVQSGSINFLLTFIQHTL